MADCGNEFEYQLIENIGSRALSTAKLLRAEINSIDKEANTADITFLDTCDEMVGVDASAVPFWYHCEFSTGTIEDLAFGHKAFAIGDMVYVIFNAASGSQEQLFFIVGHVDIHGTNPCADDYLVLKLGWNFMFDPNGDYAPLENDYFVTIFDVEAGCVLDLENFVEIQVEGGSTKPESFPCRFTSSVSNWINNNFDQAIQKHSCPLSVKKFDAPSITEEIGPMVDGCNYIFSRTHSDGSYWTMDGDTEWSDLICEEYIYSHYASIDESISKVLNLSSGSFFCIELTDEVTDTTEYISLASNDSLYGSISSHVDEYDCEQQTYSFDCENTYEYTHSLNIVQSFGGTISKKTISAPFSESYSGSCGKPERQGSHQIFSGCEVYDSAFTKGTGSRGLYTIFNFIAEYCNSYVDFSRCASQYNVINPCTRPEEVTIGWVSDNYGHMGAVTKGTTPSFDSLHDYEQACSCTVSLYDEVPGDKPYELSPLLCMSNKNAVKSASLENAVIALKQAVHNYLTPWLEPYESNIPIRWVGAGVEMTVCNKKIPTENA